MEIKKVSLDNFSTHCPIGRGTYAKVYLVRKKDTNKLYAMKKIKKKYLKTQGNLKTVKSERNILGEIKHPLLVELFFAFQNELNLYFILSYCPGGELLGLMQSRNLFSEELAKFYASQIVLVFEYLHSKNIIYRDLKPENILIAKDGYIKLTDFGLSKREFSDEKARSICGTNEYFAPELLEDNEGYDFSVDWWTLGILIYEMLVGQPPFCNQNKEILYKEIKESNPYFPQIFSKPLKNLLLKLLEKNPDKRLKSSKKIKEHVWFCNIDFKKLLEKKLKAPFIPKEEDPKYFKKSLNFLKRSEEEIKKGDILNEKELYFESIFVFYLLDFSYNNNNCNSLKSTINEESSSENSEEAIIFSDNNSIVEFKEELENSKEDIWHFE